MTVRKIVVTGGPAAGKTTALSLLKREFVGKVVVIPESATTLFSGGMPRPQDNEELKLVQSAIFGLQTSMESLYAKRYADAVLLCDRGTIDGAAYWPGDDYFSQHHTTLQEQLGRYTAVFHLRTSARLAGEQVPWERHESAVQAKSLDERLQDLWSQHKNYQTIDASESLLEKISSLAAGIRALL